MSRKCELTGKRVQYGNNVSHSQRKTPRPFHVNRKKTYYFSEITGKKYRLNVTAYSMRSVEKAGGFDEYMKKVKPTDLSTNALSIRNEIMKKAEAK